MRFWKSIGRLEGGLASVGAGICLFAMMIITVLSVIGRYVLHQDIFPGGYNIIERIMFPLIVFWALPLAHREGSFPRFDMVVNALPPVLRSGVNVFVLAVEIMVFAFVMWYVLRFTWTSIEMGRTMQVGSDFWPVWPILLMIPLAFALMMLEMLRLLYMEVRRFGTQSLPEQNDPVSAPV